METIKYKGREITPIMKPMLVWDNDEADAVEVFIYVKESEHITSFPWIGRVDDGVGWGWKYAKPLPEIEITVKINGVESKLSDISEETLFKLRNTK